MPLVKLGGQDHHEALACLDVAQLHNDDDIVEGLPPQRISSLANLQQLEQQPSMVSYHEENQATDSKTVNDDFYARRRDFYEPREDQNHSASTETSFQAQQIHDPSYDNNGKISVEQTSNTGTDTPSPSAATPSPIRPGLAWMKIGHGTKSMSMPHVTSNRSSHTAACNNNDNEDSASRCASLTSCSTSTIASNQEEQDQQEATSAELDVSGWSNPYHKRSRNNRKSRGRKRDSIGTNVCFAPKEDDSHDYHYSTSATEVEEDTEEDVNEDQEYEDEDIYENLDEKEKEDQEVKEQDISQTVSQNAIPTTRRRWSLFFPFAQLAPSPSTNRAVPDVTNDAADSASSTNSISSCQQEENEQAQETALPSSQITTSHLPQKPPTPKPPIKAEPQVYIPPPEIEKLELRIRQLSLDLARASSQNDTYELQHNKLLDSKSRLKQENDELNLKIQQLEEENEGLKKERRRQRRKYHHNAELKKHKSSKKLDRTKISKSKKTLKGEQSKGIHLSFARMKFGHDESENRSLGLDLLAEKDEVVW